MFRVTIHWGAGWPHQVKLVNTNVASHSNSWHVNLSQIPALIEALKEAKKFVERKPEASEWPVDDKELDPTSSGAYPSGGVA